MTDGTAGRGDPVLVPASSEVPDVFSHLAGIVSEVCQELGVAEPLAVSAGWMTAHRFQDDFSGQQLHLPQGHGTDLAARNAAIYEGWRQGVIPAALARRHELSLQHVITIVQTHHEAACSPAAPEVSKA